MVRPVSDVRAASAGATEPLPADLTLAKTHPAPRAPDRLERSAGTDVHHVAVPPARPAAVAALRAPAPRPGLAVVEQRFVYDAGPHANNLEHLRLRGSFRVEGSAYVFDPSWGGEPPTTIEMTRLDDRRWVATLPLRLDGARHDWRWGAVADTPAGRDQWVVFGEDDLSFDPAAPGRTTTYAPLTYGERGATAGPDGKLRFALWAPQANAVSVRVWAPGETPRRWPLVRAPDGTWTASTPLAFAAAVGRAYAFEVTPADGSTVLRPDPYARLVQGEQRGVDHVFLHRDSGVEVGPYDPAGVDLFRFEIQQPGDYDEGVLVFRDEAGRQLGRAELLRRLATGDPALDPQRLDGLVDTLRAGAFNDFWLRRCDADGRIHMVDADGTFTALVHSPAKLAGLRYELQLWKGGKLVGARDGARFTAAERRASGYNDAWDDHLAADSGKVFRFPVVAETRFPWRHDAAPRELDPRRWVVYQLHVGAFLSAEQNARRSTFDDLTRALGYLKSLGVNTLELLPVNEFAGKRNWGYDGASTLSIEGAYGFTDADGRLVTGLEALQRFVDEAHRQGLNVVNDVVYNHMGEGNALWELDGKANSWFDWSSDPARPEWRETPWGRMPAYSRPEVRRFFVDHAAYQMAELHFDALRFDFTHIMTDEGGADGTAMLREINRQVHALRPGAFTVAENFPYDPWVTTPPTRPGGAGFDAQWYSELEHRLVHDDGDPGLVQRWARGETPPVSRFATLISTGPGLGGWDHALTQISNHDEVGNGSRVINVANGERPGVVPGEAARNVTRLALGLGLTAPGVPMFFMGDEFLARNGFHWGRFSTADMDWRWRDVGADWDWSAVRYNDDKRAAFAPLLALSPEARARDPRVRALPPADRRILDWLASLPEAARADADWQLCARQSVQFVRELLALRSSTPAFDADAQTRVLWADDSDGTLAFVRSKGSRAALVVASFDREAQPARSVALPPGRWREVFNSDSARYGGANVGNRGATFEGGCTLTLPAGAMIVLERQDS